MMRRVFEWDPAKDAANKSKHGVSFETAKLVFDDPLSTTKQDRIEDGEMRWQTVGLVGRHRVLLVAHAIFERIDDGGEVEVFRLISARKATWHEREAYEDGR